MTRFQIAENQARTNEPERRVNVRPALTATALGEQALAKSVDITNPIPKKCSVEGCERRLVARGLCMGHYSAQRRGSDPYNHKLTSRSRGALCDVVGCERRAQSIGKCKTHRRRELEGVDVAKPIRKSSKPSRKGDKFRFIEAHATYAGPDCLIWPFHKDFQGYGRLRVGALSIGAHRLMCWFNQGEPPHAKAEAAHRCGNASCVNPKHLRWATTVENHADKKRHGTSISSGRKFTPEQRLAIRNDPRTYSEIASSWGCTITTVWQIKNKRKLPAQ